MIYILGVVMLLWVGDAGADYLFFYEGTFWDLLVLDVPSHEVYVRTMQSAIVLVFGMVILRFFNRLGQSRERIRRSERQLQSTLDALSANIAVLDEEGTVLSVNKQWIRSGEKEDCGWSGYGVGENYIEIIEETGGTSLPKADAVLQGMEEVVKDRAESFEVEYPCRGPETERWFLLRGHSVEIETEKRVVIEHMDVTERKKREEKLCSLSEKFHQLVEFNADGMMVVDEEGGIKFCNPAAADLFHQDRDELVGSEFDFAVGGVDPAEIEIQDEKRGKRVVEIRSTGVDWEGQNAYLIALRDITERTQARRRILRLNSLLKAIREVNQALVKEDAPADLLQRSCDILHRARQYEYVWAMTFDENGEIEHAARAGIDEAFDELVSLVGTGSAPECIQHALQSTGTIRTVDLGDHCEACPLRRVVEGGKNLIYCFPETTEIKGLLSIRLSSDLQVDEDEEDLIVEVGTELGHGLRRAEAEKQLMETQRQVVDQERQRALNTMASGIAHDFNNALSTIRGFTDLLLQSDEKLEDKDTLVQYLEHVRKAASNAGETVQRMRKFYRPREEDSFASVQLNDVIDEAVSMTRPRWKEQAQSRGANIELVKELDDIPRVSGNESELHELLTNLIFNAVDAMPRGGTLSLSTHRDGDNIILEVGDTGRGMTDDERWHCFDPFYTTKGEEGMGLGLSMVQGIVDRHEGEITVDSEKNIGTTFCVVLPIDPEASAQEAERTLSKQIEPRKILVVEDDEKQRELLREYLEIDDHQVETAADGREGLQKSRRNEYDLIITDHAMPNMSGERLAGEVKNQCADTEVVLLTGFGDMMDAAGTEISSVDVLLSKPVTFRELRSVVVQAVEEQK